MDPPQSLSEAKAAALNHYSKSFQGFSAMITPEQANQLSEYNSVVSVFESKMNKLYTTHSWNFLGLETVYKSNHISLDTASDVIVGVIDSGIWPESERFTDHGLGPVSKKFKGECVTGDNFTLANCNDSSLNPIRMEQSYGLIYGNSAAATGVSATNASFWKNNILDPTLIMGKTVICTIENFISEDRREKALTIMQGGGVGMILIDHNAKDFGFQFVFPTTLIGLDAAEELQAYINIEKNPTARIYPTITVLGTKPAPDVATFSSMGPNIITPDIIKAIAAIIKSHYPHWGPAAIKSAIMTTGRDPNGTQTTPFDYGSGHVNPVASLNPGLVYKFNSHDVLNFLCINGASPEQLKNLTAALTQCQKPLTASYNFNYPSIGVSNLNSSLSVYRTVTYYGQGPTLYHASVENPSGVNVKVTPEELKFSKTGEKITFRIDFFPFKNSNGNFVFGALIWNNGIQSVRSPIALNAIYLMLIASLPVSLLGLHLKRMHLYHFCLQNK
ncbi:Subtilisin-like protease [Glycine soja]|nr:Subtilisin-like protease [Glycine soja]